MNIHKRHVAMEKQQKAGLESLGNVEQIREILFGQQYKELNSRIEEVMQRVDQFQQRLEHELGTLKNECNSRIQSETETMQKRLKQSVVQLQEEITDSNEQTLRLERRLQSAAEQKSQEIEESIDAFKKQWTDSREEIRVSMAAIEQTVQNEIERRLGSLDDAKLSKDLLAQMLMDMAMRVQNVSLEVATEGSDA